MANGEREREKPREQREEDDQKKSIKCGKVRAKGREHERKFK